MSHDHQSKSDSVIDHIVRQTFENKRRQKKDSSSTERIRLWDGAKIARKPSEQTEFGDVYIHRVRVYRNNSRQYLYYISTVVHIICTTVVEMDDYKTK